MTALRRAIALSDLATLLLGTGIVIAGVLLSVGHGSLLGLGAIVALLLFAATVVCFLAAPHIAVALTIPLFAFIPTAKVLITSEIGPAKDVVTLAAGFAVAIRLLQRDGRRDAARTDGAVFVAVALFIGLYVLNLGGALSSSGYDLAWVHGVRLVTEPLVLLLAGLLLPMPQRTLRWGAASLVATGCAVAAYGVLQQLLGPTRLIHLGYSYRSQVRMIGPYLRSFGTLDDPFAYAAFLLLALATVMFCMRKGIAAFACGTLIVLGLVVSFVQTAAVVVAALAAVWFIRAGRAAAGAVLFAALVTTGFVLALATSTATEAHSVRAGPNTYLTLNGRASVWSTVFAGHLNEVPLGLGVGEVGRASVRAKVGVTEVSGSPNESKRSLVAVDSGYLSSVADVGLAGLAVLLFLFGRLFATVRRASLLPGTTAGWLGMGYLTVLLVDATTRDSFSGFPNAFLGLLFVGVTVAVAREEISSHRLDPAPLGADLSRRSESAGRYGSPPSSIGPGASSGAR